MSQTRYPSNESAFLSLEWVFAFRCSTHPYQISHLIHSQTHFLTVQFECCCTELLHLWTLQSPRTILGPYHLRRTLHSPRRALLSLVQPYARHGCRTSQSPRWALLSRVQSNAGSRCCLRCRTGLLASMSVDQAEHLAELLLLQPHRVAVLLDSAEVFGERERVGDHGPHKRLISILQYYIR